MTNFQREGSISNSAAGKEFEKLAHAYFKEKEGLDLKKNVPVEVGITGKKAKFHKFDLGCNDRKILIECKSHTWTKGRNVPSAKMTVWNEAMLYFLLSPQDYRKVLFIQKDICEKRSETLAGYYIRSYKHLIPDGVEIIEYDITTGQAIELLKYI